MTSNHWLVSGNWLQGGKTFCDFAFRVLTDHTGHPLFSWQMPTCLTNLSLSRSETVNKEKREAEPEAGFRPRLSFYFEGEQFLVLVCVFSSFTPSQWLVSECLQTAAATKAITRFWVWLDFAIDASSSYYLHLLGLYERGLRIFRYHNKYNFIHS